VYIELPNTDENSLLLGSLISYVYTTGTIGFRHAANHLLYTAVLNIKLKLSVRAKRRCGVWYKIKTDISKRNGRMFSNALSFRREGSA